MDFRRSKNKPDSGTDADDAADDLTHAVVSKNAASDNCNDASVATPKWPVLNKVGNIVLQSLTNTTAHGWPRFAAAPSVFQRCVWFILIVGSISAFSYHLQVLVARYIDKPTIVKTQLQAGRFKPPDVYLCNLLGYSRSQIFIYKGNVQSKIVDALRYSRKGRTKLMAIGRTKLFRAMKHPKLQMLVQATVNGASINYDHIEEIATTYRETCFRYQPRESVLTTPDNNLRFTVFIDGMQTKLEDLTMPTFLQHNIGAMNYGVRLSFTARNHILDDSAPSLLVSPGFYTEIGLSMTRTNVYYSRHKCTRRLRLDQLVDQIGLRKSFFKTPGLCLTKKLNRLMYETCGCVRNVYTTYVSAKFAKKVNCDDEYWDSKTNSTRKIWLIYCMSYRVPLLQEGLYERWQKYCSTFAHCSRYDYTASASSLQWPLGFQLPGLAKTVADVYKKLMKTNVTMHAWNDTVESAKTNRSLLKRVVRENYLQVLIRPLRSRITVIDEELAYPLANLFSDIGGILGLYMGVSVMTLLELFEMTAAVLRVLVRPRHAR